MSVRSTFRDDVLNDVNHFDDLEKYFGVEGITSFNVDRKLGSMRMAVVYIAVSSADEVAGFVYLRRWPNEMDNNTMEIAYALMKEWRGGGLIQQMLADLFQILHNKVDSFEVRLCRCSAPTSHPTTSRPSV